MPRGSAGGKHHTIELLPPMLLDVAETPEDRHPFVDHHPAAYRVANGLGLLEDLLEHEVRIAAALDLLELPRDLIDRSVLLKVVEIPQLVAVTCQDHHVAVIEIDHLAGVADDCSGVRC